MNKQVVKIKAIPNGALILWLKDLDDQNSTLTKLIANPDQRCYHDLLQLKVGDQLPRSVDGVFEQQMCNCPCLWGCLRKEKVNNNRMESLFA